MALVVKPNLSLCPAPKQRPLPFYASNSLQAVRRAEAKKFPSANAATPRMGKSLQRGRVPAVYCFAEVERDAEEGRIPWSDVVVKRRVVYWGRKWSSLDAATAGVVLSMHVLCLFAPFTFRWGALWTAVALYIVTGLLGITLSFHRNLAHRSFKLPRWLEYLFAYCGVQALQVPSISLYL